MIYQWSQRGSEKFRWLGNFIKQIICLLEFDKAWEFDKVCWKLILSIFVLMWVSACADGVFPTNFTNRHKCFQLALMGLPTNYTNWHECFQLALMGFFPRISQIFTNISACADGGLPTNCTNWHECFQLALMGFCPRISQIFTNVLAFIYWTNLKLYSYLVVLPAFLG